MSEFTPSEADIQAAIDKTPVMDHWEQYVDWHGDGKVIVSDDTLAVYAVAQTLRNHPELSSDVVIDESVMSMFTRFRVTGTDSRTTNVTFEPDEVLVPIPNEGGTFDTRSVVKPYKSAMANLPA